ncbi:MAG: NTP transferase domain-containing protein [Bacteroidetes bacterium]|nr:NTP transferase domain-containing protein [Bacteroidota bacterium]
MKEDTSVIILAAGTSSRMGNHKYLLKIGDGTTFLESIAKQYDSFGCSSIIIVLNKDGYNEFNKLEIMLPPKSHIVVNNNPELGRFYSIKTGAKIVSSDYTFIHNVDNPYAKKNLLNQLYRYRISYDVIKPIIFGKGGHPILISRAVINKLKKEKRSELKLNEFISIFSTKEIDVNDKTILLNINTPSDFNKFLKI